MGSRKRSAEQRRSRAKTQAAVREMVASARAMVPQGPEGGEASIGQGDGGANPRMGRAEGINPELEKHINQLLSAVMSDPDASIKIGRAHV